MEFLVTMTTRVPDGTSDDAVDAVRAREAARSRELAAEGHLLHLWRPPLSPGEWRTLGLFAADDVGALGRANGRPEMNQILASLPLAVWMTVDTLALSRHPSDPGS